MGVSTKLKGKKKSEGDRRAQTKKTKSTGSRNKRTQEAARLTVRRQKKWWPDDSTWAVEYILGAEVRIDKKSRKKQWGYFTKWFNFKARFNTLEPTESFQECTWPIVKNFWKSTEYVIEPDVKELQVGYQVRSSKEYQMEATAAMEADQQRVKYEKELKKNGIAVEVANSQHDPETTDDDSDSTRSSRAVITLKPRAKPIAEIPSSSVSTPQPLFMDTPEPVTNVHRTPVQSWTRVAPADLQNRHYQQSLYTTPGVDINQYESPAPSNLTVNPHDLSLSPSRRLNTKPFHPGLFSSPSVRSGGSRNRNWSKVAGNEEYRVGTIDAGGTGKRTTTVSMQDSDLGRFQRRTESSRGPIKRRTILLNTFRADDLEYHESIQGMEHNPNSPEGSEVEDEIMSELVHTDMFVTD